MAPEGAGGDTAVVVIHPSDTVNKVLPTIFGNNLPAWRGGLLNNATAREHVLHLKIGTLRIPGGNWSNTWLWDGINHWDGTNQDGYSGTFKDFDESKNYLDVITSLPVKQWPLTTDELLSVCRDWGAEPQICVNYALARYIDASDAVQQAAHYAAEWVRYVKRKGYQVKYWEIGNEHYGSWEAGYVVDGDTLTGAKYGADAAVFIDSMKAADPDIKVGITVFPGKDYWSSPNFTPEVLQAAGDKADFLISHEYFTWAPDPNSITYEQLLNALPKIRTDYETLQALVREYTNKESMPVAMTEYHYFAGLKETEGVAILFFARALGEYITHGYGLVNYWDIENGSGSDDHGMLTYDEDSVANDQPHPSFFPYYLYQKMFGDVLVASSHDDVSDLFVYSSLFSNEYAGVVVINQSGERRTVKIAPDDRLLGDTIYWYALTTPALSSRKIYLNGETAPPGEWYGPRDYASIVPYALERTDTFFTANIEGYSVNFFVFQREEVITAVPQHNYEEGLTIVVRPNPARGEAQVICTLPREEELSLALFDLGGRCVRRLSPGRTTAGKHLFTLPTGSLPAGMYILRASTPEKQIIRKVFIRPY